MVFGSRVDRTILSSPHPLPTEESTAKTQLKQLPEIEFSAFNPRRTDARAPVEVTDMSEIVSAIPGRAHPGIYGAWSKDRIVRLLRDHGHAFPERSDTFNAALVLLASLRIRHNVDALAKFCGVRREVVARCARRLHDNGVWQEGRVICSWMVPESLGDDFRRDVAVAEGKLWRRLGDDGYPCWAPPGYWYKSYGFVDPEPKAGSAVVYLPRPERESPSAEPTLLPAASGAHAASEKEDDRGLAPATWIGGGSSSREGSRPIEEGRFAPAGVLLVGEASDAVWLR